MKSILKTALLILTMMTTQVAAQTKPYIFVKVTTRDQSNQTKTFFLVRQLNNQQIPQRITSWGPWVKYKVQNGNYTPDYQLPGMTGTAYAGEELQFISYLDKQYMGQWRQHLAPQFRSTMPARAAVPVYPNYRLGGMPGKPAVPSLPFSGPARGSGGCSTGFAAGGGT